MHIKSETTILQIALSREISSEYVVLEVRRGRTRVLRMTLNFKDRNRHDDVEISQKQDAI